MECLGLAGGLSPGAEAAGRVRAGQLLSEGLVSARASLAEGQARAWQAGRRGQGAPGGGGPERPGPGAAWPRQGARVPRDRVLSGLGRCSGEFRHQQRGAWIREGVTGLRTRLQGPGVRTRGSPESPAHIACVRSQDIAPAEALGPAEAGERSGGPLLGFRAASHCVCPWASPRPLLCTSVSMGCCGRS